MAYRNTEITPVSQVPDVARGIALPDWQSQCEQAETRAEAAEARVEAVEARVEELKSAELLARTDAGYWKSQFHAARCKRLEAVEEAKQARREVKVQAAEMGRQQKAMGKGMCRCQRTALKGAVDAKEEFKGRLGRTTARVASDPELRKAYRRLRCQKSTLNAVTKENTRLHRTIRRLQRRIGEQEAVIARLRTTRAVLSNTLYGSRSEKRDRSGAGRPRGQVRGASGHGRTPRPGLEERIEEHNPPEDARICDGCGKSYVSVGTEQSTLLEIEVKAHRRVIRRGRWRRTCDCTSSPVEVSASPVPRLFPNTSFGVSVWSQVLYERYACLRPVRRIHSWLDDQGLPVAAGTLADSMPRFVPLFEPLVEAIRAHQNAATLRHADETSWRVQELRTEGRSARAWLWVSVGNDTVYFHIDRSRSAEAAQTLFGEPRSGTILVCDRYSAYKKLVRLLGGLLILQYCLRHQRRDFIQCAAGQIDLAGWCEAWLEQIAAIYRLNEARLEHHNPGIQCQSAAYDAAQEALETALNDLFASAGRELAGLPEDAREGKALRSLVNHREGLTVFVKDPRTPMDNNLGERLIRNPVIGRRLSFGSDSRIGAHLTALLYSVIGTLYLNGINVLHWLNAWLGACARNGGRPPDDLAPWLPWSMDDAHRRALTAPG